MKTKTLISFVLALTLIVLFCSCSNSDHRNDIQPTEIDLRQFTDLELDNLLEISTIIPLEYSDRSILPDGMLIPCEEGFFFKSNRHNSAVFYFNEKGEFLSEIGAIGKGPGEFTSWNEIFINDEEVVFQTSPGTILLRYDYNGNFIQKDEVFEKGIGSIVRHPANLDYYVYSPLWDYMIYRIGSEGYDLRDSLLLNSKKISAGLPSLWATSINTVLFRDPMEFKLDVFEIRDTIRLKYQLNYGFDVKSSDSWDSRTWSEVMEKYETRDVRRLLESKNWLYICSFLNTPHDHSLRDISNFVYSKKTNELLRLPGHLLDNTYFDFAFRLSNDNVLYTSISMTNIMENEAWMNALEKKGIEFNIDGNPLVVKIPLDDL